MKVKQYKHVIQEFDIELILPISDGQDFTFSFPASTCKNNNIVISLYFDNHRIYSETFYPSASEHTTSYYDKGMKRCYYGWLGDDKGNIVFRVHKSFPTSFSTYVNDKYMRHTSAKTYTGMTNHENRVHTAGVAIQYTSDIVAFTLTVFNYGEYGKASSLAHTNWNPESRNIKESDEGQAVEDRGANLAGDGADSATSSSVTNVRPRDADQMKYSSTVAWPIAVELEAINLKPSLQQRHDGSMREWVEENGDNISLSTYDYFAHSHRVAWPEALSDVRADIAVKIRERHAQLFKKLP